jgi:beta-glucosidase
MSPFPCATSLPLVFALSSLCHLVAAQDHTAITPVPKTGRWMERHEAMNARVEQGDVDLLFIGDSITQGWEGNGKDVWAKFYGERKAVNLGISGDRTEHVLWRLDNGNIEGIAPKAAVIMIGTNNSRANTPGEIVDGVTAIVHRLRTSLPDTKILLLDIFPRGETFNDQRGKILQVNQTVRKLDDGEHVQYLAIGHHFLSDDGSISRDIMPDFLHLTAAGYQIWAEAMEAKLAELLKEPGTVQFASS